MEEFLVLGALEALGLEKNGRIMGNVWPIFKQLLPIFLPFPRWPRNPFLAFFSHFGPEAAMGLHQPNGITRSGIAQLSMGQCTGNSRRSF